MVIAFGVLPVVGEVKQATREFWKGLWEQRSSLANLRRIPYNPANIPNHPSA